MAKVLSFLIRNFSNYYTLHRSDLAARASPLDPRLVTLTTAIPLLKFALNVLHALQSEYKLTVNVISYDMHTILVG